MPRYLSPLFVNPLPLFVTLSLLFVAPEPLFCHPEPLSLSPRAKRGVPRHLRASGRQGRGCHPEASAEGSPWGRRPEGSEGCLAIAWYEAVRFFETAFWRT
jgi:hypothetical protein